MASTNVSRTIDFQEYKREDDNYRFFRTTCGLVGFIVFFLGTFCAFIIAGDTDRFYVLTVNLGAGMLIITTVFFCCVIHESKRVKEIKVPSEGVELVPLVSRSEKELPIEPQPEPQEELHWPSEESDGNTQSESDLELQELIALGRSGKVPISETGKNPQAKDSTKNGGELIDVELDSTKESDGNTLSESDLELQELIELGKPRKVSITETGKNPQAKDSTKSGGELIDVELDSTKAGPSKVADRSSEVMESQI